jgi:glucose-6-phosphate 1-dehydrogenase
MHETERDPVLKPSREFCDISIKEYKYESFIVVIFGGAGDYTRRMLLPSFYHLFCDGILRGDFSLIGLGLPAMDQGEYQDFVRNALNTFSPVSVTENQWNTFREHLHYISSSFHDDQGYSSLMSMLDGRCSPDSGQEREIIFYFAVPPSAAPVILKKLEKYELCTGVRPKLLMEKPFGSDKHSAVELDRLILNVFREVQVYRVDHYLNKEPVQNIIFLRFANRIFETLWNRDLIEYVEITVAEQLGVEHRGVFYEEAGVVRDVVQNHLIHLLALVAMDPPARFDADLIRDERIKVIRSIRPMDEDYISRNIVRGQYGPGEIEGKPVRGYREEEYIDPASNTSTFFAAKFYIDNPRWEGVPFFVRTGKRMAQKLTEITVHFRRPSQDIFQQAWAMASYDSLRLCIQPDENISLGISVKCPGTGNQPYPVTMDFKYEEAFPYERHSPHERIILDCLKGNLMLFARQDSVEAMWDVVDPIVQYFQKVQPGFPNYRAGSWGPPEAEMLIRAEGFSWSQTRSPAKERMA